MRRAISGFLFLSLSGCGGALNPHVRFIEDHAQLNHDVDQAVAPEDLSFRVDLGYHARGWDELPIPLVLDSEFSESQVRAIVNAARTWSAAAGRDLFTISDQRTSFRGAQLYDLLDDDVNSIVLRRDWHNTGKPNLVLATAIWSNDPANLDMITSGDIAFNGHSFKFEDASVETDPCVTDSQATTADLESVALHELGHLLGLAHPSMGEAQSVMGPAIFVGSGAIQRSLFRSDVARIRYLYGPAN